MVTVSHQQPCVLALDGEREIELRQDMTIRLKLNPNGPRVIDARKAIEIAARAGRVYPTTLTSACVKGTLPK